jgi:ribulose-5-phosphate 4-epimerase/fuculose-1-phosphate aldolase
MATAIELYPDTNCVIVRRHGCYVWSSDSWQKAKTMTECYDYLFQIACQMKQHGVDPSAIPRDSEYYDVAQKNLEEQREVIDQNIANRQSIMSGIKRSKLNQ